MMKEFDSVILDRDMPEHGLKKGDHGAVVHCYPDGKAYEVEFFDEAGSTIGVFTITEADVHLPPRCNRQSARRGLH